MAKNRVTNSKVLADIVLNRRSNAYKELCAICDEDGIQSDRPAERLRSELSEVLMDLLRGKFDAVNQKLNEYPRKPASISIASSKTKPAVSEQFFSTTKAIRIGDNEAFINTVRSNEASPEYLVYGVLARALETGDIQYLGLCKQCEKLFYRKSLKGKFCGDDCRWTAFNHREGREEKAHERYEKRIRSLPGKANVRIDRRPRKKPPS